MPEIQNEVLYMMEPDKVPAATNEQRSTNALVQKMLPTSAGKTCWMHTPVQNAAGVLQHAPPHDRQKALPAQDNDGYPRQAGGSR